MVIYPAIDIKDGKCVRLTQGKFDQVNVYSDNPADIACKWEKTGAHYLHVIDLDGARTGTSKCMEIVREMAARCSIPIQLGGGIRCVEDIEMALLKGVQRVIIGTSAVKDQNMTSTIIKRYRDRIAIGIDAKDGMVAIEGWEKSSEFKSIDFAKKMVSIGAQTIIYTDISRDGMLTGPNLPAMEQMVKAVDIEVIASGGVSNIEDIKNLKEVGVSGVIVGKALYTGNVDLKQALEINSHDSDCH